jgi:RNA polymerase sigma factor (sigma-70 family)
MATPASDPSPDDQPGSVSILIDRLKKGDHDALTPLWKRYFPRLAALARRHLDKRMRRVVDGEDVAATALESFCTKAERGEFTQLHDRADLWSLLVAITMHKVTDERRRQRRGKRTVDRTIGDADFDPFETRDRWDNVPDPELSPEDVVMMEDQIGHLLYQLKTDELRTVAILRLYGYTVPEIAERMRCVTRTVERRLEGIRDIWSAEFDHDDAP